MHVCLWVLWAAIHRAVGNLKEIICMSKAPAYRLNMDTYLEGSRVCWMHVCVVPTETQLDEKNLHIKLFLFPKNILNLSDNKLVITGWPSSPCGKVL